MKEVYPSFPIKEEIGAVLMFCAISFIGLGATVSAVRFLTEQDKGRGR